MDETSVSTVRGRCHSNFRDDGKCLPPPQSYTCESVQKYFPGLIREEPLIYILVRSVVSISTSMRARHQSVSQDSVGNGPTPNPVTVATLNYPDP